MGEGDIDWEHARSQLDERGFVLIPGLLTKNICKEVAGYYAADYRFRVETFGTDNFNGGLARLQSQIDLAYF